MAQEPDEPLSDPFDWILASSPGPNLAQSLPLKLQQLADIILENPANLLPQGGPSFFSTEDLNNLFWDPATDLSFASPPPLDFNDLLPLMEQSTAFLDKFLFSSPQLPTPVAPTSDIPVVIPEDLNDNALEPVPPLPHNNPPPPPTEPSTPHRKESVVDAQQLPTPVASTCNVPAVLPENMNDTTLNIVPPPPMVQSTPLQHQFVFNAPQLSIPVASTSNITPILPEIYAAPVASTSRVPDVQPLVQSSGRHCEYCGQPLTSKRSGNDQRHKEHCDKNPNRKPSVPCEVEGCNKSFKRPDDLARHMREVHKIFMPDFKERPKKKQKTK